MIKVEFLGPIARESEMVEAESLRELSEKLKDDEKLSDWLPKCAVAVNDTMVRDLDMKLADGDRVTILPPVCGG